MPTVTESVARHLPSCVLAVAVLLLPGRAADAATIRFRAAAECRGVVVKLGDLADISNAGPEEAQSLAQIVISPAPAPGSEVRIDAASVRSRLGAQGVNLAKTDAGGSGIIVVTNPGEPGASPVMRSAQERSLLSQQQRVEKQVTQAITQYLQRVAPEMGRVNVSINIERKDVPALFAGMSGGYEVSGGAAPWNAPQTLTVRTLDRDNAVREATVLCRVIAHPYVVAVKQTVPKGYVLQPGDLAWRQTDNADGTFIRFEDVIGRETQRTIRPEEVIRSQDIRTVPLVRSNDIVTVAARAGGIQVKRLMKAKSDGGPGETVTLIPLTGRETIVARVTGYHEAEVVGSGEVSSDDYRDDDGRIRFERESQRVTPAGFFQSRPAMSQADSQSRE